MKKGTDLQSTVRVLEDATRFGIWNHACMILGFPTERMDEAVETISWLKEHKDLVHSYYLFDSYLYDESYIYCNPGEFCIDDVTMTESWFSNLVTLSTTEELSRGEVRELIKGARRKLLEGVYQHPFWYYLRDREYLQLYLDRFGLDRVRALRVNPADFSVFTPYENAHRSHRA